MYRAPTWNSRAKVSRRSRRPRAWRPVLGGGGFYVLQGCGYFFYVGNHRDIVIFEPGHFAVLIDDGDGAASDALSGEVDAVFFTHGAARMKIGEQRILDVHFVGVGFVRPDAVDADAENLRIQILERLHFVDEAGVLVGAGGAPVERVPYENDVLLAAKIRKLYFFFVLIVEREIRRYVSNSDGHEQSS